MSFRRSLAVAPALLALVACSSSTDDAASDTSDVVNAEGLSIEQAPWQVFLESRESGGGARCGATVLAPNWVVTAHHCLAGSYSPSWVIVVAGLDDTQSERGMQTADVDRIFPYALPSMPSPQKGSPDASFDRTRDIELLHLVQPLDLSGPRVKAIPIVDEAGEQAGLTKPGTKAFLSGFSGGTRLTGGDTVIAANEEIEAFYKAKAEAAGEPTDDPAAFDIHDVELVTRTEGESKAKSCFGDSGGPLVVTTKDGKKALAGVVSWGGDEACTDPKNPNVYARVSSFSKWIKETMAAYDATLAHVQDVTPADGAAAKRDLDAATACKVVEAWLFDEGYEDLRGFQIDLASFRCEGKVTTTPKAGAVQQATVSGIAFTARGDAQRTLTLDACLTHPADDAGNWWTKGLAKDGRCSF